MKAVEVIQHELRSTIADYDRMIRDAPHEETARKLIAARAAVLDFAGHLANVFIIETFKEYPNSIDVTLVHERERKKP